MNPELARRWEPRVILAVALHSYGVAFAMICVPAWGAALGGWGTVEPLFFMRQAGAFHAVVATAYLLEFFRWGRVDLILLAKSVAVVFLLAMWALDGGPWAVPWSAFGDGSMAVLVAWVHRWARA